MLKGIRNALLVRPKNMPGNLKLYTASNNITTEIIYITEAAY